MDDRRSQHPTDVADVVMIAAVTDMASRRIRVVVGWWDVSNPAVTWAMCYVEAGWRMKSAATGRQGG
jgi:hypothetical protein